MKLTKQGITNLDAVYGYVKKKSVAVPPPMLMEAPCNQCLDLVEGGCDACNPHIRRANDRRAARR